MDIMAKVESTLKEIEDKINEVQAAHKDQIDAITQARQGFNSARNCFKDHSECGGAIKKTYDAGKAIKGISSVGKKMETGDLTKTSPEELAKSIKEDGTYKRGQGKDIKKRNEMEEKNNVVVTANIARLFAKGIATRQSIRLEKDDEMYDVEFKKSDMDEILFAQNNITLNSKRRIAHILELRSYMYSAEALKELTQYNREHDEEEQ